MQLLCPSVIFQIFGRFAHFHVLLIFLTDAACPTHPQQLLFSQSGDSSSGDPYPGKYDHNQTWIQS